MQARRADRAEVQLLGRVTYEGFAAAWPKRREREEAALRLASSKTLGDGIALLTFEAPAARQG